MGIFYKIKYFFFVSLRIWKYQLLSDCQRVTGKPNLYLPLLLKGKGKIQFGNNFQNGVTAAHYTYSTYNYILSMEEESEVIIGDNVVMANGASLQAVNKITIEDNVMIGINCFLVDTDGHDLDPDKRMTGIPKSAPITIKKNVLIYYNTVVFKGVTIGENSVIGACSVVTKDIPANVFASGNPARVIRNL
ncbi:acyltransferase [Flavobacterium sp.]|uniref:acyltransferase n=1 Tax=Flavobacterium sp. TaxID=239 RepID=UPI002FD99A47